MNIGDRDNYKTFDGGEDQALLAASGRQRELKDKPPGFFGKIMGTSPYKGTTLSKQQVNQCVLDVQDLHPLRSTKVYDVVPPLGFLRRCKRKKGGAVDPDRFLEALRESILSHETMNLQIPENEKKF